MTSATLYREGPDLDELLAELDAEHGGLVRVVDVNYVRDGGVMGFFARRVVGVHYTLATPAPVAEPHRVEVASTPPADNPLEVLLRAAEAAEMVESGVVAPRLQGGVASPAARPGDPDPTNVEFARMLLDMAAQKAADRRAGEPPVPAAPPMISFGPPIPFGPPVPAAPPAPATPPATMSWTTPAAAPSTAPARPAAPATPPGPDRRPIDPAQATSADLPELLARVRTRPIGAHRAPGTEDAPADLPPAAPSALVPAVQPAAPAIAPPPARTQFTLRRQLTELGVPAAWVPEGDTNAFLVIEQLVERVPVAPRLDPEPGELVAVVGPAHAALAEARQLCLRLRLDPSDIVTAGGRADPISHRRQAAALARAARREHEQAHVVVVATDSTITEVDPTGLADLEWAAGIVAALEPDRTIAVVDATSKPSDVTTMLETVGAVSALAVLGAGRTASPAALWRLGAPVATLDGRPATRGAWAALLIDRLAVLDRG